MEISLAIIFFFFGAIIGSFLNVVILRYRSGRPLGGRSGCMTCGKQLTWTELVPIGSFFTQRGKCVGCRAPISWQYPIVEAVTGILFVFLYYRLGYLLFSTPLLFAILFAYYGFIVSVLVVLSAYDIRHKILPDKLVSLFGLAAFIGMFFIQGDALILHFPTYSHILAGLILPAPFAAIWLFSKGKWMGLGDAKLMIGIGFLLGLSSGLTAILLSFWIGAVIGVLMLVASRFIANKKKRLSLASAISFGPFLALGTVIVILGQFGIMWIASFFH